MNISTRFIPHCVCAAAVAFTYFCPSSISAADVACEAGGLQSALKDAGIDTATETSLTVTGELNASDFAVIRDMPALKTLDLSGATVASEAIPEHALLSSSVENFTFPEGVTEIGSGAFGNSQITKIIVPSTVTTIDTGAFSNMENLTEVIIPASVGSLPSMLFKDCQKLQRAEIYAHIVTLPDEFFRNCPALTAVSLPSSLTSIGNYAFSGCSALASISLPDNLQSIGNYAFASCTSLTSITTPMALSSIGDWCFAGCDNLKDITFRYPVATFGQGAFYNASALTTSLGNIAAGTTELPDYLLYNASAVETTGFETTNVEKIGARALSGNNAAAISLPGALNYLGDNAMENWSNLEILEAIYNMEVPELGSTVWEGVDQAHAILYVPSGMMASYKDAPQWQDFTITELAASDINLTDSDTNSANLRGAFDGSLLRLEADTDIRAAQLYDVAGRCLTIVNNYQSNRMAIDTAPYSTSVFIIRVLLADYPAAILKLAR